MEYVLVAQINDQTVVTCIIKMILGWVICC